WNERGAISIFRKNFRRERGCGRSAEGDLASYGERRRSPSAVGSDRRGAVCPPGGGLSRNVGILQLAFSNQPVADPGKRVLVHRGRRGLARLLPGKPVYQRRPRLGELRAGGAACLRPMADLDVGERRGDGAGRVASPRERFPPR